MYALAIDLTERLANAALGGGIALLIAWAVNRWARQWPAAVLNWVWRLAILKCLVGLFWVSPWDVSLPKVSDTQINPAFVSTLPRPATWQEHVEMVESQAAVMQPLRTHRPVSREEALAALWLVGVGLGLAYEGRRLKRVRAFLAETRLVDDGPVFDLLKSLSGRRRPPQLRVSSQSVSPLLIGQWRPILVVPEALLAEVNLSLLEFALLHELCHLKRRDPLWTGLFQVVRTLLFFHPLLWWARRPWTRAQEAACDATALGSGAPREPYEDALIGLMRLRRQAGPGLAVVSGTTLQHRLVTLGRWRKLNGWQAAGLGAALFLTAVVGLIPWRLSKSGTVGVFDDGHPWPQPIGEIDWRTPRLASPAESNGFKVVGIERIHDYERGQMGDLAVNGPFLEPFTTAIWVEMPDWAVNPFYPLPGHGVHKYAARMITSAGSVELHQLETTIGKTCCFSLPVGYPDSVHSADLEFSVDGKKFAQWHVENLPKSPVLRTGSPKWVTQDTAVGVSFTGYVKRVFPRKGAKDWLGWEVYNTTPLPTDKYWDMSMQGPVMERVATSNFGSGGSGVSLYGPMVDGTLQTYVGPGGLSENSYAFADTMTSAALHCDLVGFKTNVRKMTLRHIYLKDESSINNPGMYVCVNDQDRFDTPLRIPIRICLFPGFESSQPPTLDPSFSIGLPKEFSPYELPDSPLAKYGKPIRVQIATKGFRSQGGNTWMDKGFIGLSVNSGLKKLPDEIEIIFTERVDLEKHPMDFLVPIEGPETHQPKKVAKR